MYRTAGGPAADLRSARGPLQQQINQGTKLKCDFTSSNHKSFNEGLILVEDLSLLLRRGDRTGTSWSRGSCLILAEDLLRIRPARPLCPGSNRYIHPHPCPVVRTALMVFVRQVLKAYYRKARTDTVTHHVLQSIIVVIVCHVFLITPHYKIPQTAVSLGTNWSTRTPRAGPSCGA